MREKIALNALTLFCWSAVNLSVENVWLRLAGLALVAMALANILAALDERRQS